MIKEKHKFAYDEKYLHTEEEALELINSRQEQFYVYVLINPLNNLPFYVGKGQGGRCFTHWRLRSQTDSYKNNFMRKLSKKVDNILYVFDSFFNSEVAAFKKEGEIINKFGLKIDNKKYPLYNIISGDTSSLSSRSKRWSYYLGRVRKELPDKGYDYSKSLYKTYSLPIEIICPEHGSFWQTISTHLNGHGCPKCSGRLSLEERIFKLNNIHNNKYDYSLLSSPCPHQMVDIICPEHGVFTQYLKNHQDLKRGCPKCKGGVPHSGDLVLSNIKEVLKDYMYNYSRFKYINSHTEVEIICPVHGVFLKTTSKLLRGEICPNCISNSRRVVKSSLNSKKKFLKLFETITEASLSVNGFKSNISSCCRGVAKSAYGYDWWYLEDYIKYLKKNKMKIPEEIREHIKETK